MFQSWYQRLQQAGNRLDQAKVLHHQRLANGNVFCYTLWVKVWVASENRFKENEFVVSRKDISVVVPYFKKNNETYLVMVKEFRSAVNNPTGYVFELPGGSSPKSGMNPKVNAKMELTEETGIVIDVLTRFEEVGSRQLMATMCSHHAHVYRVELTEEEFLLAKNHLDTTFGSENETEITYLQIVKLSELKQLPVDFSTLGIIYQCLY